MFHAKIQKTRLQQIIDSLFLVDEAMVQVRSGGLSARVQNKAKTAKAEIQIDSSAFEEYEAGSRTLGLDLKMLRDIAKRAEKDELIELFVADDDTTLKLTISEQDYFLTLIHVPTISPPGALPEFDTAVNLILSAKNFDRAVSAADVFSDKMTFKKQREGALLMEGAGDDNRAETRLSSDELIEYQLGEINSTYDLEFLDGIRKALHDTPSIEIGLGKESPCHLSFKIADGSGTSEYYLAPFVENN